MEYPNQVNEQRLPDAKLKLVQKVNNYHPRDIEFLAGLPESLTERILCHSWSDHLSQLQEITLRTIVGNEDVKVEQTIHPGTRNGMANPIDKISCGLYLFVKALANCTDSKS